MPKIYCIETGGTFASIATESGFKPDGKNTLEFLLDSASHLQFVRRMADFYFPSIGHKDHYGTLQDSTNIKYSDQIRIAYLIEAVLKKNKYDGIIVSHGTDSMAYTAALLSILIPNPSARIILTGAMKGFDEPDSDAKKNFADSTIAATCANLSGGIYVVFNGRIIPGSWATKISSKDNDAFRSVHNETDLARIVDGKLQFLSSVAPVTETPNTIFLPKTKVSITDITVDTIVVDPTLTAENLEKKLSNLNTDGYIIEGFGSGSIPQDLLPVIKRFAKVIPIIVSSQIPLQGHDTEKYEVERSVAESGIMNNLGLSQQMTLYGLKFIIGRHSFVQMDGRLWYDDIIMHKIKCDWINFRARWGTAPQSVINRSFFSQKPFLTNTGSR